LIGANLRGVYKIFKYKMNLSVGDNIKVELLETFNGVTLIAKE